MSVLKARIRDSIAAGDKEEESVHLAFKKFDVDGSGTMSVSELSSLAQELGTFPALSEEELEELLLQVQMLFPCDLLITVAREAWR